MDDVERLFRQLVSVLADDPGRLYSRFQVSELYQKLVPYRAYRSALGFESAGDYEMAVLRLLAGERGYASVEPAEARDAMRLEAEAINPDPGAFREFAGAGVTLNPAAVRGLLRERDAYAPPGTADTVAAEETVETVEATVETVQAEKAEEVGEVEEEEQAAQAEAASPPVFEAVEAPAARCPDCNEALPRGRTVVFCPYCARQLLPARCRRCGDDVEPGWQYCVTCGHPVSG